MPRKPRTAAKTAAKPARKPRSPKPAKTSQATAEGGDWKDQFHLETQADVARAFEVERSTVHSWIAKGMPGTPGDFCYMRITRWLLTLGPWRSQFYIDSILQESIDR